MDFKYLLIVSLCCLFLAACGGSNSDSDNSANTDAAETSGANFGVSGINLDSDGKIGNDDSWVVITNISLSPGSGNLSKSRDSLRAVIDFEYDPDYVGAQPNGGCLFAGANLVGDNDRFIGSDYPAGKLDVSGGRGQVLLSFSLSREGANLGRYNEVNAFIGCGSGSSGLDKILSRRDEPISITLVD